MRTLFRRYLIRFLLLLIPAMLSAANVSSKITDRLGRPVTNALVDIHWLKTVSQDHVIKVDLVKLISDGHGLVKGKYDEKSIPSGEDVWVEISKTGYNGYSTTGLRREFVLEREFGKADLLRIAALKGIEQVNELRELLAGEFEDPEQSRSELVFVNEQELRPGLRSLVADSKVGATAGELLAFIGLPEDLRLFLPHAPAAKRKLFEDRWAYGVVSALLEPTTDLEWAFLRSCAMNERDDRWVETGAIRTLKLIASSRSKGILMEVERRSKGTSTSVGSAMRYIDSSPAPLSDANLIEAARKAAQVITIGKCQRSLKLTHLGSK